jgi:DNA-binding GntR family transcriptional regulator
MIAGEIVRTADLREQVYDALRRRIIEGAFRPGDRLTEVQVAKDFGVSRTPAREALVMLTQSGLIVTSGRSFQLPIFTPDDIRAIFEIRRLLEPYAIRKIVTETEPARLKNACGQMRELLARHSTYSDYIRAHTEFRQMLFDLLSNERLGQLIATSNVQVHFIRLTTLIDAGSRNRSAAGNKKLVAAIEARDADAAAANMVALIDMSEALALSGMH